MELYMPNETDQHLDALRTERSDRLNKAMCDAIAEHGGPSLEGAHGAMCFHFDDGITMQILFDCHRAGYEITHEGDVDA